MAWSGQGDRSLIVCGNEDYPVRIFRLDGRSPKVLTFPEPNTAFIAGSPDGRWLATSTHHSGRGFRVWDVRTGVPKKTWDWGDAVVAFSPDSRWLVACTGRHSPQGTSGVYSWRVGTWEQVSQLELDRPTSVGGHVAISPDSRVLAVTSTMSEIRLLRLDTFEEMATLTAPDTQMISGLAFSPDGSRLAAAGGKTVHVWDLRAIRRQLKALDLDWTGSDYPAEPPADRTPYRFEVVPPGSP
jgi:WD40 repeat protein